MVEIETILSFWCMVAVLVLIFIYNKYQFIYKINCKSFIRIGINRFYGNLIIMHQMIQRILIIKREKSIKHKRLLDPSAYIK
jgi:hypothetical protein